MPHIEVYSCWCLEYLDSVVFVVIDIHHASFTHSHLERFTKLTRIRSAAAKRVQNLAVQREDTDAVLVVVAHVEMLTGGKDCSRWDNVLLAE